MKFGHHANATRCDAVRRWLFALGMGAAVIGTGASSCQPAPKSDDNTPTVYMLAFQPGPNGTQAAQVTVRPGGSFDVKSSFLGPNKADIRIYGEEHPGVATLTVTGTGRGNCSTKANSDGQFYTAPGQLSVTFPTITMNATPAGNVDEFVAADLDKTIDGLSCGTHIYNGMSSAQEFFLDAGTLTLTAVAANCCGRKGTGQFTINVS